MKVTYQNLTDKTDPCNGKVLSSVEELSRLLDEADPSRRRPFSFELAGSDGRILTLGIEGQFGHAFYTPVDDSLPFLNAIDRDTALAGLPDMEFIVGGTPTPVDGRLRVPVQKIRMLIEEFLSTGELSPELDWEELRPS